MILYSNHNNTPFELVKTIPHTCNRGFFGIEDRFNSYIYRNTISGKQIELLDEHIPALLHKGD